MAEPPTPPDDDRTIVRPPSARAKGDAGAPGHVLPIGTRLREYEITGLIGEGGFGIVYLAEDVQLERRVAVKEYMPSSMASRVGGSHTIVVKSDRHRETFAAGLKSFINEARLLARFDHPALLKVYRFWEENGTAYMAMPYYEGPTLKSALASRREPPDEATLRTLLRPLLDALSVMHAAQCFHRDIAPDNILLTSAGPLLLDFGAARRVIGDMTHALTVVLKPGYAPIEQYGDVATMTQGAWTDLYALACVVYFAITGKVPMSSVERLMDDRLEPLSKVAAGRYSERFLKAIDAALAVRPQDRPQTDAAFRALLGEPESPAAPSFVAPPADDLPTRIVPRTGGTTATWRQPPTTGGPPVPPLPQGPVTGGPPVPPLPAGVVPTAPATRAAPDEDVTVVATNARTVRPVARAPAPAIEPPAAPSVPQPAPEARTGWPPPPADTGARPSGVDTSHGRLESSPASVVPSGWSTSSPASVVPSGWSTSTHGAEALAPAPAGAPVVAPRAQPLPPTADEREGAGLAAPAANVRASRAPLYVAAAVVVAIAGIAAGLQWWPSRDSTPAPATTSTPGSVAAQPSTTTPNAPTTTVPTTTVPTTTAPTTTAPTTTAPTIVAPPITPPPVTSTLPPPERRTDAPAATDSPSRTDAATRTDAPSRKDPTTRTDTPTRTDLTTRPEPTTVDSTPSRMETPPRTSVEPPPRTTAESTRPRRERATRDEPRSDAARNEPPVSRPARTPNVQARCSDILQKASLESLTAEESAFLRRECR